MTDEAPDFALVSTKLGVKESVLRILMDQAPYTDTALWIMAAESNDAFWERVNSLPPLIVLELHKQELLVELTGKDFPDGSIDPFVFDYFQANCISSDIEPIPANPIAIPLTTPEMIVDLLQNTKGWSYDEEEKLWNCADILFDVEALQYMCDAYIGNGNTWINCPYEPIRNEYSRIAEYIEKIDQTFSPALSVIWRKLRQFKYCNSREFVRDMALMLPRSDLKEFDSFEIAPAIVKALGQLMVDAENIVHQNLVPSPHPPIDDITISKAEALSAQMALPFPQRTAFALTPSMISARLGTTAETGQYEKGSLAELLFCDSEGQPIPLPYQNCSIDFPSAPPSSFTRVALRRFVSLVIKENEFNSAPSSVIDILTDLSEGILKNISQDAKRKSKNPQLTQKDIVRITLSDLNLLPNV
ncbi:hypothetical protein TVAG_010760 [Trichomonas vaginalis G3]|uniref:Uncharacterized protein n=1 Tax=Trichomonas vaginalis (strain ATCC PRA-98 / G3) TaxID=412133 RepID=A2DP03_TRIV3|nr:hypothetical protein TVAGG3_0989820 [Trichomonas vaginalis G3]EAY17852.1 hypothetical protein TVAG_010760 [Trichomonas vaginalis G3]KAI5489948.1 hypothetical protein TVAGG3_0989820 [Trichomonas vaginalis G3]|eukprot:XP_001329987.1 hypothetical protein [Trichomonas vaginalis G3]